MPDPEEGVTPDSPTGSQEPVQPFTPDPATVNAGVSNGLPTDRPVENIYAEWNRKFSEQNQRLDQLMAILASQPQPVQPNPTNRDYTDEQLAELARAGSIEAQMKLQERIAQRTTQAVVATHTQVQMAQSRLASLYSKYPQLQNSSDPLTVEAMKIKYRLVQSGRPQVSPDTDLEAIKDAIADFPHLINRGQVQPSEFNRQAQARPQSAMDGGTTRQTKPSNAKPGKKITDPKVLAIAQRMGVNPDEAMARFEERQKKGQSSVSPMVHMIVREEN